MSKQARIQTEADKRMGIESYLCVGTTTHVGEEIGKLFTKVFRLPELDPP